MHDCIDDSLDVRELLKQLTPQDFQNLGLQQVAYIRPVEIENKPAYAVHAADGSRLLVTDSMNDAAIVIENNELEAITLH